MATILNTQPLSSVVTVNVYVSATAAAGPSFNEGLIVGTSPVIPTYGVNPRLRLYTSLTAMSADGFTATMPEYIAAGLYFGQTPTPTYLWVGRQDLTALNAVTVGAVGGTGYVIGDILTVVQAGAQGGEVEVLTIGSGGVVTSVALVPQQQGTGYTVATNLSTTGGTGTGCEITITAVGETALQALTTCRIYNVQWYAAMVCGATDADALAIGPYAQAAQPVMMYFHSTSTVGVANGTAGNIALELKALAYTRVYLRYATTQSGAYPNNVYSAAAAMGVAMGHNTGLANSFYIMKFQTLVGISYEPLTATQITNINNANCNVVVNYANNSYNFEQQGTMTSGTFFDQIIGVDQLVSDLQYSVMNLLTSATLPMTNAGGNQLATVCGQACARSAARGFIQPGTWTGSTILNLTAGTALPNGYLVQFASYSTLSTAQLAARQASPLYVTILTPGAIQSVSIALWVSL